MVASAGPAGERLGASRMGVHHPHAGPAFASHTHSPGLDARTPGASCPGRRAGPPEPRIAGLLVLVLVLRVVPFVARLRTVLAALPLGHLLLQALGPRQVLPHHRDFVVHHVTDVALL